FSLLRPPPSSPPFPYTTLFRSPGALQLQIPLDRTQLAEYEPGELVATLESLTANLAEQEQALSARIDEVSNKLVQMGSSRSVTRSEEHTSELQSRENLVCRLLL